MITWLSDCDVSLNRRRKAGKLCRDSRRLQETSKGLQEALELPLPEGCLCLCISRGGEEGISLSIHVLLSVIWKQPPGGTGGC